MKICYATSECVPFAKTGGLADVGGALPKALSEEGCEVKVFLPYYASIDQQEHNLIKAQELHHIPVTIENQIHLFDTWYGKLPDSNVEVYFIDCPEYFHRPDLYTSDADEDERFILFQHAILQVLQRYHWAPDVVHCNDWQTALLPVYLKMNYKWDALFAQTKSLMAIHNIGYQGKFPKETLSKAGLSPDNYYPGGPFEFENTFSFLKTGLVFADHLSTVSRTYAIEIQSPEFGAGLDGVLTMRKDDLDGILNGIDIAEWNPKTDKFIPHTYSIRNLSNKKKNKKALLDQAQLKYSESIPVIGMVTRLTKQKGLELLKSMIQEIMDLPLQIVALGSGEEIYDDFLRSSAQSYPQKFSAYIGYNNELAHLITAGCDMFLMPSLYEPCGLNQMYSLNYGTVPIVRETGGLADTVHDFHRYGKKGNGFSFNDFTPYELYLTIVRALDTFRDQEIWKDLMKRGMKADFSWKASAKKYLKMYEKIVQGKNA